MSSDVFLFIHQMYSLGTRRQVVSKVVIKLYLQARVCVSASFEPNKSFENTSFHSTPKNDYEYNYCIIACKTHTFKRRQKLLASRKPKNRLRIYFFPERVQSIEKLVTYQS